MKPILLKLKHRGLRVKDLAEQARVSRCHLSEVLQNKPGRGGQTRRRVAPLLLPEELALLGWDENGRMKGPSRTGQMVSPREET